MMLSTLTVSFLTGCGKDKADTNSTIDTLQNVSKARSRPTLKQGQAQLRDTSYASDSSSYSSSTYSSSSSSSESQGVELQGNACTVNQPVTNRSTDGTMSTEFQIGGTNCPIEFGLKTRFEQTKAHADIHFKALTDEIKKQSDIDALDLSIDVAADPEKKSMKLGMDLTADSQKQGKITLNLQGNYEGQDQGNFKGELTGNLTFGGKNADIKQTTSMANGQMTQEVFINGEKLTPEQMQKVQAALSYDEATNSKSTALQ